MLNKIIKNQDEGKTKELLKDCVELTKKAQKEEKL